MLSDLHLFHFSIYGPLPADSGIVLDECGGYGETVAEYRYHVRRFDEIDHLTDYCSDDSPAVQWGYVIGCYKGNLELASAHDSTVTALPVDCIEVALRQVPEASSAPTVAASAPPSAALMPNPTVPPTMPPTAAPATPMGRAKKKKKRKGKGKGKAKTTGKKGKKGKKM